MIEEQKHVVEVKQELIKVSPLLEQFLLRKTDRFVNGIEDIYAWANDQGNQTTRS